ncbi:ABC transporter ATP-binding protein (plasmid) [Photobacterium damselae subsp. damselae]|uniref:ABC transporter ATP-binding protein n=1 Tax=Photobacterium damselae TaxID=38293 RepID=UPI001F3738B4|nr:ABC transporter ATP-binding protein [Photobacterium damselae]UJZ96547.1 ABC transporter ATP-binding protein [Photobacterium damselae subsp. damselae]UKA00514.1 ABC transporter ATP-binding protein [Photobacterium damselae subsp. damselae]
MTRPVIKLNSVSKKIHDSEILSDINLTISDGEFISILGSSGSGKSTLTNIIGLLDDDFVGSYLLDGIEMVGRRRVEDIRNQIFGFIFQSYYLISYLTIRENLDLIIKMKQKNSEKKKLIDNVLKKVGLTEKIDSFPNELSGGEQQRIAIARAIINSPRVIIADEPTGALDLVNKRIIYEILSELNSEGKTIILITHDIEIANLVKNNYEIRKGKIFKKCINDED